MIPWTSSGRTGLPHYIFLQCDISVIPLEAIQDKLVAAPAKLQRKGGGIRALENDAIIQEHDRVLDVVNGIKVLVKRENKASEFCIDITNLNANDDFHAKFDATLEYEAEEKDAELRAANQIVDHLGKQAALPMTSREHLPVTIRYGKPDSTSKASTSLNLPSRFYSRYHKARLLLLTLNCILLSSSSIAHSLSHLGPSSRSTEILVAPVIHRRALATDVKFEVARGLDIMFGMNWIAA
ncbi:hypothetical protein BDR04DRAFT_1229961 [Suillus decipiens]|nr:hypothetical protein BDR04DRAFT_1229961 [Suillus decipiens]